MAGSSLLLLIDDIVAVLDDVSVMTKIAAQKTAGVLGDDLALNAEQVMNVRAEREIPVVLAVAKGSLINKAILVPSALLISAFAGFLIQPLLMIGGLYLCFEGVEKLWHSMENKFFNKPHSNLPNDSIKTMNAQQIILDIQELTRQEEKKIKGAIRTDFILSAEIIIISLGAVANSAIQVQILSMIGIALVMTIGVYGLVGGIVKMDDLGLYLIKKTGPIQYLGRGLIVFTPILMPCLSYAGTVAMFLVGGGIINHSLHIPEMSDWPFLSLIQNMIIGLLAGAIVFFAVFLFRKLKK